LFRTAFIQYTALADSFEMVETTPANVKTWKFHIFQSASNGTYLCTRSTVALTYAVSLQHAVVLAIAVRHTRMSAQTDSVVLL